MTPADCWLFSCHTLCLIVFYSLLIVISDLLEVDRLWVKTALCFFVLFLIFLGNGELRVFGDGGKILSLFLFCVLSPKLLFFSDNDGNELCFKPSGLYTDLQVCTSDAVGDGFQLVASWRSSEATVWFRNCGGGCRGLEALMSGRDRVQYAFQCLTL